jgi:hypothetical protein
MAAVAVISELPRWRIIVEAIAPVLWHLAPGRGHCAGAEIIPQAPAAEPSSAACSAFRPYCVGRDGHHHRVVSDFVSGDAMRKGTLRKSTLRRLERQSAKRDEEIMGFFALWLWK